MPTSSAMISGQILQTFASSMSYEMMVTSRKMARMSSRLKRLELEKRKIDNSRGPRIFWGILCFIACAIQSYHMTEIFLRWQLIAEYLNFPMDPMELPAVTFCIDFPLKNPCTTESCVERLKTSRIFWDSMHNFEDIYPLIIVANSSGDKEYFSGEKLKDFAKKVVRKARADSWACFHVAFSKYWENATYENILTQKMLAPIVLAVKMSPRFPSNLQGNQIVLLNRNDALPSSSTSVLWPHETNFTKLHDYKRRKLNLLPPPYETKCYDYAKNGLIDQGWCLKQCITNKSISRGQGVPEGIVYLPVDDIPMKKVAIGKIGQDFKAYDDPDCEIKCRNLDCQIVDYVGKEVSKRHSHDTFWLLTFPTEPDIVVNYKPRLEFTEYLALMGSILGLWLGLSVVSIADLFTFLFC